MQDVNKMFEARCSNLDCFNYRPYDPQEIEMSTVIDSLN